MSNTALAMFLAERLYEEEQDADNSDTPGEPERIRREVWAKRGILLDYMTRLRRWEMSENTEPKPDTAALRYVASVYSQHRDYDAAWMPRQPGTVETWGRQ